MCWVFSVILIVGSVTILSIDSDKYVPADQGVLRSSASSTLLGYQKRVSSLETLTEAVESSDGRPVVVDYFRLADDLRFGVLAVDPTGARSREILGKDEATLQLTQVKFPPKTYSLTTIGGVVEQSTIQQVSKVSSLKHLEFGSAESDFVPTDLSPLVELKNLNSLNLGYFSNVTSLAPLQQLPKLEALTIGNHQLVTPQAMRQVAAIKSLRRLYLPSVTHNPDAMAALEELNQSSLDRVFVAIPLSDTTSIQTIANSIPDLQVRSSLYSSSRWKVYLGVIWGAFMLQFLGSHFSAMVTLPSAELTPGYKTAQQRMAWVIMIGLVCVGAGLLWSHRVHPGLAIAVMSSALLVSMSLGAAVQTRAKLFSKAQRLFHLLIVVLIFATIGFVMQRPLETDYLLVHPPLWGIILLTLATGYFAVKLNRHLGSACRGRIAVGNEPVLSFADLQQASTKLRSQRLGEPVEPYGRGVNSMAAIGWLLLFVVLVNTYGPSFWFTGTVNKFLLTQLPVLAAVTLMLVGVKWWCRMPFLATMATRPPDRQTQVKQIFTGVAADFARNAPLLVAVVLLVCTNFADKFGGPIELAMTTSLLAIGAVAMIYAFVLWVITVRSTRWVIVVCLLASLFPAVIAGSVASLGPKLDSQGSGIGIPWRLAMVSAAMIAIAVAATALTQRHYRQLEWGRFLP